MSYSVFDYYPDPDGYFSEEAVLADEELNSISRDEMIDSIVDNPFYAPTEYPDGEAGA